MHYRLYQFVTAARKRKSSRHSYIHVGWQVKSNLECRVGKFSKVRYDGTIDGSGWSKWRQLESFGTSASSGHGPFTRYVQLHVGTCTVTQGLHLHSRHHLPRSTLSSLSKAAITRFVVDTTFELWVAERTALYTATIAIHVSMLVCVARPWLVPSIRTGRVRSIGPLYVSTTEISAEPIRLQNGQLIGVHVVPQNGRSELRK